jgi:hypothetical protein
MKVSEPDSPRRVWMSGKLRRRHGPEEIVRMLRDVHAMLNARRDVAAVLQLVEVSEAKICDGATNMKI